MTLATLTEVQPGLIIRDMLTMQRAADLYLGDLARSGRRDRKPPPNPSIAFLVAVWE
jgi:hypothetical protein